MKHKNQMSLFITLHSLLSLLFYSSLTEANHRLEQTIDIDGQHREYIVHVPQHTTKQTLPVLMAFHPALATDQFMEKTTLLHQAPGAEQFIVVYPKGIYRTWNAGNCCGIAHRRNINDIQFFHEIIKQLQQQFLIKDKIYVTGFSNGAKMVYHLVCEYPHKIAAAAAFGATHDMSECRAAPPVPLLHIHGQEDRASPAKGGYPASERTRKNLGYMLPASSPVNAIASRNECQQHSQIHNTLLKTECEKWSDCTDRAEVELCIVAELGHTWPGAEQGKSKLAKRFGPARPDIQGSEAILQFFTKYL